LIESRSEAPSLSEGLPPSRLYRRYDMSVYLPLDEKMTPSHIEEMFLKNMKGIKKT